MLAINQGITLVPDDPTSGQPSQGTANPPLYVGGVVETIEAAGIVNPVGATATPASGATPTITQVKQASQDPVLIVASQAVPVTSTPSIDWSSIGITLLITVALYFLWRKA